VEIVQHYSLDRQDNTSETHNTTQWK
jgi:hypothetical protein